MPGFAVSERFARPPDEVFAFLVDSSKYPKIRPAIKKVEKSGEGRLGVGTKFVETRLVAGRERHSEYEVLEYERPYRYSVGMERAGLKVRYVYSLLPDGKGTELQLECEVEAEGIRQLLAWWVAESMRRRDEGLLLEMKGVMVEEALAEEDSQP